MEALEIALLAAGPLEELGVRWLIGGSVASSLYGVPRATLDVDLVADLQLPHVADLVRLWSPYFLADEAMIRGAVQQQRTCNLIHLESALKVDILGLVRTRGSSLDQAHLRRWSAHLGIPDDLLVAALEKRPKP